MKSLTWSKTLGCAVLGVFALYVSTLHLGQWLTEPDKVFDKLSKLLHLPPLRNLPKRRLNKGATLMAGKRKWTNHSR